MTPNIEIPNFEIKEPTSETHRMNLTGDHIAGTIGGRAAMEQAIFKVLQTERYEHLIYSWDYGIETMDLYGEPMDYVESEIERRITEALTADSRILNVEEFEYADDKKGNLTVSFTVKTIFGDVKAERSVPS